MRKIHLSPSKSPCGVDPQDKEQHPSLLDALRCAAVALSLGAFLPAAVQPAATFDGGFNVSVTRGHAEARVVDADLGSGQTALFYFDSPHSPEILVKVLDGCAVNGHRWVFVAAATDLPVRVVVQDRAGRVWTTNLRDGHPARSVGDTQAFSCGTFQTTTSARDTVPELERIAATSATLQGRFDWEVVATHEGVAYAGRYVDLPGDNAGLFYFFDRHNPEVLFRVQDGRAIDGKWWFFLAAVTDLELAVTIRDTVSGTVRTHYLQAGDLSGIVDRGTTPSGPDPEPDPNPVPEPPVPESSDEDLTLHGRFALSLVFRTGGTERFARIVDVNLPGESSGLFYFFSPDNAEALVKVLEGCGVNGHWWVYAAAATDLDYTLNVHDTATERRKAYEGDKASPALSDVAAFPCS